VEKLSESDNVRAIAVRIGARIRSARHSRQPRLTLAELGGERLSVAMLSRLERGDVVPSIDTLLYLSRQLDLPLASLFDSAGNEDGHNAAELERGWALFHLGRYDASLRVLQALDQEPVARVGAVRALTKLGQLDRAADLLERIPDDVEARDLALGELAFARRLLPQALDALVRAAQHVSTTLWGRLRHAETLLLLARVHHLRGSHETALVSLRQALTALSGLATPADIADALLDQHDDPNKQRACCPRSQAGALALATYASRLSLTTLIALADAQSALGRQREAMASMRVAFDSALRGPLRDALETGALARLTEVSRQGAPDDSTAGTFALLGEGYRRAGQLVEAEEQFRFASASALASEHHDIAAAYLVRAATLWLQAGDRQRASALLQQAERVLLGAEA
jgi:tetratricopeptide (TPR) repeat protein